MLPGIDDGAPDAATGLDMLRGLAAIGFERVCATPHQKAGQFLPTADDIAAAEAALRAEGALPCALTVAAENMWDDVFYERSARGAVPAYGAGPAFLVELPVTHVPPGLLDRLFAFRVAGRLPVLAHPERYPALCADDAALDRLRQTCALVVDLGAVAGYHGRRPGKLARRLVADGIAHAVASDAHTPTDVRSAAEGIAWIRKKCGDAAVDRLLADHPRRILAGELPDA
ncbi:MAG: hypothetical protein D6689_17085 [Deltaproteobacteria bacterium]|nr:MAG: hypothetical protein D6689_17085 [Deltaproteobacteria bacterium]